MIKKRKIKPSSLPAIIFLALIIIIVSTIIAEYLISFNNSSLYQDPAPTPTPVLHACSRDSKLCSNDIPNETPTGVQRSSM